MAAPKRYFVASARQIDPLSWFTGPYLPLALSALVVVGGSVITVSYWPVSSQPALQFVGLFMCALSGLVIYNRTRPLVPEIDWGAGALALCASVVGMTLSAIGYRGTEMNLFIWWGPSAVALTLVSLAPYLGLRRVLALGSAATLVSVATAFAILYPHDPNRGPIGLGVLIAYPLVMALAATATFSYSVVSTMLPLLESPSRLMIAGHSAADPAAVEREHAALARLTARAAPFLSRVAESGRVTAEDRALAGQLARRLRDDLVTQSNISWLDSIADNSRLVVVDPERLARRMNPAQRTALRGLLSAILEIPETDHGSLMIDLRGAADGATAVGISVDMTLPEGRRIMHIAPYYLTLRSTVDDLSVDADGISFRIAPHGDARR